MKFETINNQLCRMVEPEPLTETATFPCVVRLIQDETMLGKANIRACHPETLASKRICSELTDDGLFMDGNYTYRYEIIGYPVADGSAEWAWFTSILDPKHDMVCGTFLGERCVMWMHDCDCYIMPANWMPDTSKGKRETYDEFMRAAAHTGWQLYEPKLEPAKEQFAVGDWAKYDIDSYLRVIETPGRERTLCKTLSGVIVYPYTSCLTKVSPSEVVLDFGSGIKGWICYHSYKINEKVSKYNIDVFSTTNQWLATLAISALDTPTCELVESLLEAQEKT